MTSPRFSLRHLLSALALPAVTAQAQMNPNPYFEQESQWFTVFPGYFADTGPTPCRVPSTSARAGLNPAAGSTSANIEAVPHPVEGSFIQSKAIESTAAAPDGKPVIPAGKGSTTDAGKFVPAPAGPDKSPSVSREDAEKQLREALKVEELEPGKFRIGKVAFDSKARTVSLPAKVNMRSGLIEYVLTTEAGKAHEALFTTDVTPRDVHTACLLLGMKASPPAGGGGTAMALQPAESVTISVSWETNGPPKKLPLTSLLGLAKGTPDEPSAPVPDGPWHYTGSAFFASGKFAADEEGSLISLIRDPSALLNNPGASRDNDELHVPNVAQLPAKGFPVTITLQLPAIR